MSIQFNLEGLCTTLAFCPDANEVAATASDILPTLVPFKLTQLIQDTESFLAGTEFTATQKGHIKRSLKVLYSMALRNSRYNEIITDLEKNIANHRAASVTGPSLMGRAHALLQEASETTPFRLDRQIKSCSTLAKEIHDLANLHFYLDPENQEKIENLYTYSRNGYGTSFFPNCENQFRDLVKTLSQSPSLAHLSGMKNQLILRSIELRQRLAALQLPDPRALSPEKKKLYDNYQIEFWNGAAKVFESALKKTILERIQQNIRVPDPLVVAINKVAREPEFKHLKFNLLLNPNLPELSEEFVSKVWVEYSGGGCRIKDPDDLARHVLYFLSKPAFQMLAAELKSSKEGAVQAAIFQYFTREPNFSWLKTYL